MNLDGAVQAFADRIGRPVIVFDGDLNVAAFSVHEGQIDRARLSMILTHRASKRAVAMISEHRVDRAPGAVLLPVAANVPSRVVAGLRYRGRVTGYVSYVPGEDEDPDLRDLPEVVAARDDLGALLAAREAERREGADHVLQLMSRLLDGQQDQRESAADELLHDGLISAAPQYSAMVFRAGGGDIDRSNAGARLVIDRALKEISRISSLKAVGTVIDGEGVLVIPREINPARLRGLVDDPLHATTRGGGGASRERLADVRDSRREARIAVRATIRDPDRYGATAIWADLGVDRLLLQLPLDRMSLADLPDPVAELLTAGSGPDLAKTLEVYLDSGADAQRTAQRLHIHRSTLYYRLDRIRAISDADLGDGLVRRELHVALRVAALAGLRQDASAIEL
ncbi:PucR family transcriptional regulator [Agromyces archimandritae]|uniref:Helix-turn-helix domain-containing protein n=1 Tax=Agromyces archimandritae TaxID=2781962 RepID=A0A975INB8_9MICO|nr:PucR family transcriptional regulator [Agromyces archimandritae]QTX04400.1 helix-turn-helix domain-containing protein [Agromyces archimandritae]